MTASERPQARTPSRSVANPDAERAGEELTRAIASNTIGGANLGAGAPDESQQRLIAEAAYRRAEERGFAPGKELDDWLAAEREINDEQGESAVG